MSEDTATPEWKGKEEGRKVPEIGLHLFAVSVESCGFGFSSKGKQRAEVGAMVLEGDHAGFRFDFHVYINPAAENMARYFLKKFGYSEGELEKKRPTLRTRDFVGLKGYMLTKVEESDWDGSLRFSGVGYAHYPAGEDLAELKRRKNKLEGVEPEDDVPTIEWGGGDESSSGTAENNRTEVEDQGVASGEPIPGGAEPIPEVVSGEGADSTQEDCLDFLSEGLICGHGKEEEIVCQNGDVMCAICSSWGPWDEQKGMNQ